MKNTCLVSLALIISQRIEKKTLVFNNFSAHFLLSLLLRSKQITPFRETLHFIESMAYISTFHINMQIKNTTISNLNLFHFILTTKEFQEEMWIVIIIGVTFYMNHVVALGKNKQSG